MGYFYEVFIADGRYRGDSPLTYASDERLKSGAVVSVQLRQRTVSAFVLKAVPQPAFPTKPIKNLLSPTPLPAHVMPFANWLQAYYAASLGECLRQFAPSRPIVRNQKPVITEAAEQLTASLDQPLTAEQQGALKAIKATKSTTVLLHGQTGSGKTRVYLELAKEQLAKGRSVIILTPEIALTGQLTQTVAQQLNCRVHILHSNLSEAARKKIWLAILESEEPLVVVGPRSALFSPIAKVGLIVVDEAHEPAYKQEQSPRYHAVPAASQLGKLTGAKVVLGTATPSLSDYHLASQHRAVVEMTQLAMRGRHAKPRCEIVDMRQTQNLSPVRYLSSRLLAEISATLSKDQQVLVYLNRRGSARIVLCQNCGWQLLCPNCDIPLVYHADKHRGLCHTCGYATAPPTNCPQCANPDIVYRSAGTKAVAAELAKLFPQVKIARFDSDNTDEEHVSQLYPALRDGKIDLLVGTQLLAKGFDLPKLGLVGVIAAESALTLPDYTAEERTFQLLYQVIGRVGRGHSQGTIVIQSYDPEAVVIQAAAQRDYQRFYRQAIKERQAFRYPPFAYLLRLVCRRKSPQAAETAAEALKERLQALRLPVEIIGPAPNFYNRRAGYYYWQLVIKAKQRQPLLQLAAAAPADWSVDLDPVNLL